MKYRFYPLLLIFFLFTIQLVRAQQKRTFDLLKDNIETVLPPLSVLIDSAFAHNPGIKSTELQVKVKEYKLNMDKAIWTKNLGIQTDVRYGTFDNFSTNLAEGQNPSVQSTMNNQLNYGVGAFIKIPIFEALSRGNQLRSDKLEIEQVKYVSEAQRNDIRQMVIKQYNDLILKHRLFVIKTKYAETIRINMQMAETEFQKGVLSLDNYSRACDTYARSEADFEGVKMDFRTAYMTLEVLVGIKLNFYQ